MRRSFFWPFLFSFLTFSLTFLATTSHAQKATFTIDQVQVDCGETELCLKQKDKWQSLATSYIDLQHLKESIKTFLLEGESEDFTYSVIEVQQQYILQIHYKIRPQVQTSKIEGDRSDIDWSQIEKLLPLREGSSFDEAKIITCEGIIANFLKDKGFFEFTIKHQYSLDSKDQVNLVFKIVTGPPVLLTSLEVTSDRSFIKKNLQQRFASLIKTPFDVGKIKNEIEELKKDFFNTGYFNANIDFTHDRIPGKPKQVQVKIKAILNHKFMFNFLNIKILTQQELLEIIHNLIKNNRNKISFDMMKKELIKAYEKEGVYDTKIQIEIKKEKDINNELVNHYYFNVKEGRKIALEKVHFVGNTVFSREKIEEIFYKNASTLVGRHFFDRTYIENFSTSILRTAYLKEGYIFAQIQRPRLKLSRNKNKLTVTYMISEGLQTRIDHISIKGVSPETRDELLTLISNKENGAFDSLGLEEDIKLISKTMRERGYYFATVQDKNPESVVIYRDSSRKADLHIDVVLGEKFLLNNILISGNIKTRNKVILREIDIARGSILTPEHVQRVVGNLNSLGIFSQVKIDVVPVKIEPQKANLFIQVTEKNSGLVELAPGYRSDIGVKTSLAVTYNNIGGMNRSVGVKGQLNQRTDYKAFDERRRKEKKKKIEYSGRINFTEPYLFNYPYGFQTSLDITRKRFFSFDASIIRTNAIISKSLTRDLSASLKYQLESISQKDATDEIDSGHFRIGGITPGLTLDWRDNKITPTKGAYFNIGWEINNPTFLSQEKDGREINFYKLVSRNKFYYPIYEGVLAFSLSFGKQKNLADKGGERRRAIPRIKVFRMSGMDMVRGFREEEINRLKNGKDIYQTDINNDAYFINVKLEPRFFVAPDMMVGFFVDAGRISKDHFDPLDLRSSVGLSFKYLTPVGSLDFDYGFKLHRERLPSGNLERPGEFHISIGFF